jgi:sigma-B regulation protein RsbU (phosphoserine phosphatase)
MSNIYPSDLLHIERVVFRTDTASRLFPNRVRNIAAFDYYGESQLAGDAGGDFFDFISVPSNGLITALGDVSGQNSAAAALLIPGLRAFLRTRLPAGDADFRNVVRDLNRTVCDASPDSFYASLFCASFEPARGLLRYVNAGHEPALLVRGDARSVHHLESTGTVLGLTTRAVYGVRTVKLEPGDMLVAFTEGVVETAGGRGQVFGEPGILEAVRQHPDARANEMVAHILDAVRRFADPAVQATDRTAIVVRCNAIEENPLLAGETAEPAFAA